MCYCGLFVNEKIKNNPSEMRSIPERRPREIIDAVLATVKTKQNASVESSTPVKPRETISSIKVWRCTVCGYLCARGLLPPICPICKAKTEHFEQFVFGETK